MTTKTMRNYSQISDARQEEEVEEHPFMRLLMGEACRRGDTQATVASYLGVNEELLTQWSRREVSAGAAGREVHQKLASYLGFPTALVMVMSGSVGLGDFAWPSKDSMTERLAHGIKRLQAEHYMRAFVPTELAAADPAVQLFVTFLFHELEGGAPRTGNIYRWLSAFQKVASGNPEGSAEVEALEKQAKLRKSIF